MNRYIIQIAVLLVLFSLFAFTAVADAHHGGGHDDYFELAKKVSKDDMTHVYEQLDLSEKQKQSLEVNRKKHHAKIKQLTDAINSLKKELSKELAEPAINEGTIRDLKSKLNSLQSQLSDIQLEGIMGVRGILTSQQYNLFYEQTR